MSWDAYIKMLQSPDRENSDPPVTEAAICGMLPGAEAVWISTPGLAGITVDEIKKLAHDRKNFSQVGAFIAGRKCMLLRDQLEIEDIFTLDLKTSKDCENNSYGVCVGKSNQALVIAMGTKEASGGQLANKVFAVVKHLRSAQM